MRTHRTAALILITGLLALPAGSTAGGWATVELSSTPDGLAPGKPYARVDVLRDADGQPAVLELELIEPSLFLDFAPGSAEALARAILARLPA